MINVPLFIEPKVIGKKLLLNLVCMMAMRAGYECDRAFTVPP
jgi:hypothetical protein